MSRIISLILSLLIVLLSAFSCSSKKYIKSEKMGATITIKIPKVSSNNGEILFSLYNSKENFNNKTPYQTAIGKIENLKTSIQFANIPEGNYAIISFHDANSNHQLDFDGFIPVEDYGCSNNPQLFGPPTFEQLQFEVGKKNLSLEINY